MAKKKPTPGVREVDRQAAGTEKLLATALAAGACQPDPGDKVVDGLIKGIAPMHGGHCFLFMDEDAGPVRPLDGRCILERDHPNYNALFSLCLVAATNRIPIRMRTKEKVVATENARVCYAWVTSF